MPEKPKAHTNKRTIKHDNIKKVFTNVLNNQSNQSEVTMHESSREPFGELPPIPSLAKTDDSREPDIEKFSDLEEDKFYRGASETYGNNIPIDRKEVFSSSDVLPQYYEIQTKTKVPNVPHITIAIQPAEDLHTSSPKDCPPPISDHFSNLHTDSKADHLIHYEEDVVNTQQHEPSEHNTKLPADSKSEKAGISAPANKSSSLLPNSKISSSDTNQVQSVPNITVDDSLTYEQDSNLPELIEKSFEQRI